MWLFTRDEIQRKDIDTLKRHLRQKIGGYTVACTPMKTDNLLFRGVKCNVRPEVVSRISYPPARFVTENGRLNRSGKAIFYASKAAPSVFFEIHAAKGDTIALSQWKVREQLWMHNLGYHHSALKRLGTAVEPRSRLAYPISNETKFNDRLRQALSLACTVDVHKGNEYLYKLSIAINELMFDGAEPLRIDLPDGPRESRAVGTVYPAMKLRGVADNVAIWPKFVDGYLTIGLVQWVVVVEADEARSLYTIQHLATCREFPDGKLVWDETPMNKRDGKGTISLEGDKWISRNGLGEIYDVH
jgi:hypothetical protein